MKRKVFFLGLVVILLLLAQSASAASTGAYQINWTNLLTGSGGPAGSASYHVNYTVGQSVTGTYTSPSFQIQLGYWSAVGPGVQPQDNQYVLNLPILKR